MATALTATMSTNNLHRQARPTRLAMTVTAEGEDAADEDAAEEEDDATEQQEEHATDTKWIHSQAKKSLRTDIILGKVKANSNPEEVYDMRTSYKRFPFKNFKTNLESLILAVSKDIARMQHDCEAHGHDLAVVKALRSDEEPGSRPLSWHLSDARKLLKTDMAAGKHKQLKPMDLWNTKEEYKVFTLDVFRKAIHAADDKKAKLVFRMEKKKFRAPPPATPAGPLPHIPMTFGATPQRKKGKGRLRKALT